MESGSEVLLLLLLAAGFCRGAPVNRNLASNAGAQVLANVGTYLGRTNEVAIGIKQGEVCNDSWTSDNGVIYSHLARMAMSGIGGKLISQLAGTKDYYSPGIDCNITIKTSGAEKDVSYALSTVSNIELAPVSRRPSTDVKAVSGTGIDACYDYFYIASLGVNSTQNMDRLYCDGITVQAEFLPLVINRTQFLVRFHSAPDSPGYNGFSLIYTIFKTPAVAGTDCSKDSSSKYFLCDDSIQGGQYVKCIPKSFLCNYMPNCLDGSDESSSLPCKTKNSPFGIFAKFGTTGAILAILGITLVALFCFSGCICCLCTVLCQSMGCVSCLARYLCCCCRTATKATAGAAGLAVGAAGGAAKSKKTDKQSDENQNPGNLAHAQASTTGAAPQKYPPTGVLPHKGESRMTVDQDPDRQSRHTAASARSVGLSDEDKHTGNTEDTPQHGTHDGKSTGVTKSYNAVPRRD